jgi:anaerobic magnesium-protoporphyrin IX monomethyl ester cyclase
MRDSSHLKAVGYDNIRFVDAMTDDIPDDVLREIIRENAPDVVLATAITPMIYKAQTALQIAKEECPDAKAILGGIHPTFMYVQVLTEAPWIDYIVRGEGEEIIVNLMQAISAGVDLQERRSRPANGAPSRKRGNANRLLKNAWST